MENPLLVFISSVIAGMRAEREAAEAAIRAIPLSRPWVFEHSPASALPLAESYLRKVRECDIFVLLLGATLTDPVKQEVKTAQAAGKPLLVFLGASAPADVTTYAQSLAVKYATYQDAADLAAKVAEAVGDELITGYRRYRVAKADLTPIGDFLDGLTQGVVQIGGAVQVGRDQTVQGDLVLGGKIGRQVNTGGGNFIGHDLIIGAEAPPEDLLRAYYRAVAAECRRLPLGVIDTEFVRTSGNQPIPLPDIYVDLEVVAPAKERGESKRAWALRLTRNEGERTSLLQALAQPAATKAVLLGDPGSGKTTFVNNLTYLLSTHDPVLPSSWRELLPVRLVLRDVAARCLPAEALRGTAQMLWEALECDIVSHLGAAAAGKLLPYLQSRLLTEGGFILLDGLDEVPEARRRRVVLLEAIRELTDLLEGTPSRLLVTARPYAYADKKWQLAKFATLALAPFSEAQVRRFVTRWYGAVRPFMGWNEETAQDKGNRLQTALQKRSYLADLASRPLLLTLMATLHSSWGELPEDRASLYEETVKLLLSRWQRTREIKSPDGELVVEPGITQALSVGEERIRAALETLAYATHDRQYRRRERDEGPADITEGEVLWAFKPLFGFVDPDTLLGYLKDRTGLLIAQREEVYAFPHQSFQEYLAACHLANGPEFGEQLERLVWKDPAWWREVCLLGVGKTRLGGLGNAVAVVNVLLPANPEDVFDKTETRWRIAALAGQALVELRLPEKAADHSHYEALLNRARRWLVQLLEGGHLAARERAAASDVLGQLGDPRFDPALFFLPSQYLGRSEPTQGFVEIPAGPFVMGSQTGDQDAYDDELGNPPLLDIPYCYWVARYPVTVAQFGAFWEDGGYEADAPWWTEAGRLWRSGEWDSHVQEDGLPSWLQRRPKEMRAAPWLWDEQQSCPNRAMMGVSWFEALAYSRWLDTRLRAAARWIPDGYVVRLPTEAEWEKAARAGDARKYPWGDESWEEQRANILESQIGRVTTVGMYPGGATPAGVHDLSGNVWEWTLSLYQPYAYKPEDGRNAPDAEGGRVGHGGSWYDNRRDARCACRDKYGAVNFYLSFGFRVVVSLSNSGF